MDGQANDEQRDHTHVIYMIAVIYIAAEIEGLFIRSCPFSLQQKYQLPVHLTFMDGAHTIHTELINSGERT